MPGTLAGTGIVLIILSGLGNAWQLRLRQPLWGILTSRVTGCGCGKIEAMLHHKFRPMIQCTKACLRSMLLAALSLALASSPVTAQAPVDVRIALVIGNAAYPGAARLVNPVNDARAMGAALRNLGFTVVELLDGDKAQMVAAINRVRGELQGKQGVGMLYYAGHGLQVDWRNYMVPVNARLGAAEDVPEQAMDVGRVIDAFKAAGNRMNILILDACRDNPFSTKGSGKGLAPLDAPTGTFLAYATAPGNVAEDGSSESGNGLYTAFLLQELSKPESRIEDVFKRVRLNVRQQSQGRQIPWESTSLEDDFYFNASRTPSTGPAESARELAFAIEKTEWDKIKLSTNPDDFYAYLKKYPSGTISELATATLEKLDRARITSQPDQQGMGGGTDLSKRFKDGERWEFVIRDAEGGPIVRKASTTVKALGNNMFRAIGTGMPSTLANGAGFVSEDGSGSYDPPWASVPGGEFRVGNSWSSRANFSPAKGPRGWVDVKARVVAKEAVTVPLGTFQTYRVEVNFKYQYAPERNMTLWYVPDWGFAVKQRVTTTEGKPYIREMAGRSSSG